MNTTKQQYSDQLVESMTNAVWQSLSDAQLQDLTWPLFSACVAGFNAVDEAVEDAWYEFTERRNRVFT